MLLSVDLDIVFDSIVLFDFVVNFDSFAYLCSLYVLHLSVRCTWFVYVVRLPVMLYVYVYVLRVCAL